MIGPGGQEEPVQILEATRYADGGLKTARLAFVARDVPAMGYGTYHIAPRREVRPAWPDLAARAVLENDLYRLSLDANTGAMTSLRVKSGDWEVLSGRGNIVARQQDRGDFWEPYKGLDGGSRIAMTTQQPLPRRGESVFSDEGKPTQGNWRNGPVLSEFQVMRPFGTGRFATTVRLYRALRRIEVTTRLVNNEKYVRYQVLFPTTITRGKATHEIPFGAIERPQAIEFPAQNWVDYGDGQRGLTLLNIGLPGNLVTGGTMIISLLRAHTLGAYGFGGGYEPGMSSDSGFQLGRERTVRYALLPHAGDWREARVFRDGLEFNHPLVCRKVTSHEGSLPPRWGLLEVSNPHVVVSALEARAGRSRGLAILRGRWSTGPGSEDRLQREGRLGAYGQSSGRPRGRVEGRGGHCQDRLASVRDQDDPALARAEMSPILSRWAGREPASGGNAIGCSESSADGSDRRSGTMRNARTNGLRPFRSACARRPRGAYSLVSFGPTAQRANGSDGKARSSSIASASRRNNRFSLTLAYSGFLIKARRRPRSARALSRSPSR